MGALPGDSLDCIDAAFDVVRHAFRGSKVPRGVVSVAVRGYKMTRRDDLTDEVGVFVDCESDDEERCFRFVAIEQFKNAWGCVGVRAVVECECYRGAIWTAEYCWD